jgi:hypothetical protein
MKTGRALFGFGVLAGMVAIACWIWQRPGLPRFRLSDGGEFRVLKITYLSKGSEYHEHNLNAPPAWRFALWRALPDALQGHIDYPDEGIGAQSSDHPAISIWWAWFDPKTSEPVLGPAGDVWMTLDSGERFNLNWPDPAEDYRQILIVDPSRTSRTLTFDVPVVDDVVHFTIDNPAYRP